MVSANLISALLLLGNFSSDAIFLCWHLFLLKLALFILIDLVLRHLDFFLSGFLLYRKGRVAHLRLCVDLDYPDKKH